MIMAGAEIPITGNYYNLQEWSENSAKVFVLSFRSPLYNFVHAGHGHWTHCILVW